MEPLRPTNLTHCSPVSKRARALVKTPVRSVTVMRGADRGVSHCTVPLGITGIKEVLSWIWEGTPLRTLCFTCLSVTTRDGSKCRVSNSPSFYRSSEVLEVVYNDWQCQTCSLILKHCRIQTDKSVLIFLVVSMYCLLIGDFCSKLERNSTSHTFNGPKISCPNSGSLKSTGGW